MSIYLDFIRFIAAMAVFIWHADFDRFTGGLPFIWTMPNLGNDAVIVFFVLSGFVISYVADNKEKNNSDFFISRFSRLYSVVLPALVLTLLLDHLGQQINPAAYASPPYQSDNPAWRLFSNLFFLNELWFNSIRPFSNGPFWSIGYEFWYYVIFAMFYYFQGSKRLLLCIISCLIAGPKILLLFPIWLSGLAVYKICKEKEIRADFGLVLFIASLVFYLIVLKFNIHNYLNNLSSQLLPQEINKELGYSSGFLSKYLIGIIVCINFIGFHGISKKPLSILIKFKEPITIISSFTFAIYLLHFPILNFISAILEDIPNSLPKSFIIISSTLIIIFLLGNITEKQKYNYRKLFLYIHKKLR